MLDEWPPAVAVPAAATQLGVERVEDRRPERADLLLADQREDAASGESAVGGERVALDLQQLDVAFEQLLDGRGGLRAALLVDLDGEPAQHFSASLRAVVPAGTTSRR